MGNWVNNKLFVWNWDCDCEVVSLISPTHLLYAFMTLWIWTRAPDAWWDLFLIVIAADEWLAAAQYASGWPQYSRYWISVGERFESPQCTGRLDVQARPGYG